MKYRDLISKIRKAAKQLDIPFVKQRQKGSHQVWLCGTTPVVIPKHGGEINEITAISICKTLEEPLGEGWWK
jgi:predicted RNA binding protein YcfA (HicA-like mRNA interferase family)